MRWHSFVQADASTKKPRKFDLNKKESDSITVVLVKGLLAALTAPHLATLVKNISSIGQLHTGSACTGSNIAAVTLATLFSVLNVGVLCDTYGCESALALVPSLC